MTPEPAVGPGGKSEVEEATGGRGHVQGPHAAAFFDLDGTLLARSSVFALAKPLRDADVIRSIAVARGLAAQALHFRTGGRGGARARVLGAALRNVEVDRLRTVLDSCVERTLAPLICQGATGLLESHREAGRSLYLVSSAPEEVVTRVAAMLGVDSVLASQLQSIDGVYTGHVSTFCQGQAKADAIRHAAEAADIDLATSYAFADNISDLAMLETVGRPMAVNADRELTREARRRGWELLRLLPQAGQQ